MRSDLTIKLLASITILSGCSACLAESEPDLPLISEVTDATQPGVHHSSLGKGDRIFTGKTQQAALHDTTGAFSIEAPHPEPRFSAVMAANKPAGSYVIKFPNVDAGGPCSQTGLGRYEVTARGPAVSDSRSMWDSEIGVYVCDLQTHRRMVVRAATLVVLQRPTICCHE